MPEFIVECCQAVLRAWGINVPAGVLTEIREKARSFIERMQKENKALDKNQLIDWMEAICTRYRYLTPL